MNTVTKSIISDKTSQLKNNLGLTGDKPKFDWNDFNYPPLLHLIHLRFSEIDQPYKGIVIKLFIHHIGICIIALLNIISNIAQVAVGSDGLRILYSFIYLILFPPLATLSFYLGYRATCADETQYKWYFILTVILTLLYFVFMIANFANFDGFVRVGELFSESGQQFAGVVSIIESVLYIAIILLNIYCFYLLKTDKWKSSDSLKAENKSSNKV